MSLRRKPHSVTVYTAAEAKDAGVQARPTFTENASRRCQITPWRSQSESQGSIAIDMSRPHLLLADSDQASIYTERSLIQHGARWFEVKGAPEIWDAGTGTNCFAALLEELDYVPNLG